MQRKVISGFVLLFFSVAGFAENKQTIPSDVLAKIEQAARDATIVAAVVDSNAETMTLAKVMELDKKWIETTGTDDFMELLMRNDAARAMDKFEQSEPYFVETILMNKLGANVAMTNKTSDYWQGDEAKFQQVYEEGGLGKIHIGKEKYDESARAYLVQVSVPVRQAGRCVGVMTIGVNLDILKTTMKK